MRKAWILGLGALLILSLGGCGSTTKNATGGSQNSALETGIYPGTGSDISLLNAIKKARIEVVKKFVIDLIGVDREPMYKDKLTPTIYSMTNPNAYTYSEPEGEATTTKNGEIYTYVASFKVNKDAVIQVLKANGIPLSKAEADAADRTRFNNNAQNAGNTSTGTTTGTTTTTNTGTTTGTTTVAPSSSKKPTPEEIEFINDYLSKLVVQINYVPNKEAEELNATLKATLPRLVTASGVTPLDEKALKDYLKRKKLSFEEATGNDTTVSQAVADSLGVDITLKADIVSRNVRVDAGSYKASVKVSLTMVEASTGESITAGSKETLASSFVSYDAAKDVALKNVLKELYDYMIQKAVIHFKDNVLPRGLRYLVNIDQFNDDDAWMTFIQKLKDRGAKSIKELASSGDRMAIEVYLLGDLNTLKQIVSSAAKATPGMENLKRLDQEARVVNYVLNK